MAKAKVIITADNQLRSPLKQAQQDLKGFEKVANQVGDTLKNAFTVTAIVAGLKVLKDVVGDCVDAFKTQNEAMTRLQATIKATGSAYKYTAQDIKTYSSELQNVTRFGDDVIEETAALLIATQKFDKEGLQRTIELSADLAEAMGEDLPSAASTLQKALIEPGTGLSRLRSIGITFTDAEEEMIESLKNAGKEFEAQQVILDKVEAAYGGMAKSIASVDTSTLDKIANVWGDLKEDLGNLFTNILGPVFEWIYDTLKALERLANQVAELSNFNKYLYGNDSQALADNFTAEYLNNQLEKMGFNELTAALKEDWAHTWHDLMAEFDMSFDEFIKTDRQSQMTYLKALYPDNSMKVNAILNELTQLDKPMAVIEALAIQEADTISSMFKAQEKEAEEQRSQWAKEAQANRQSVYDWGKSTAIALMAGIGNTVLQGNNGTLGPSATLNSLLGTVGINMLNTQKYLDVAYQWDKRGAGVSAGLNFGVKSDFGLPANSLNFKDTMSLLGPEKVKQYLDMGSKDIQDILKNYGKYSKSYQNDLLDKSIENIQTILDTSVDPSSPLGKYFSEIIDGLEESKQEEKDNRTFLQKFGEGVGSIAANIFGADSEQGKNFGGAVITSFASNMGTAGEVAGKLATNMAAMGPALGAIATALEYVFQGINETLGPVLEEFMKYGIEPLKELGRIVGELLVPVFENIMPLVQKSADSLMKVFNMFGQVLGPIIDVLSSSLTPVLDVLCNIIDAITPVFDIFARVLIGVTGTIQYVVQGLQHWVAVVFNWLAGLNIMGWQPFAGLRMTDPGSPGDYIDFMNDKYADYDAKMASVHSWASNDVSTQTAVSSAQYRGATSVTINVYAEGPIVGDGGMREFARMIRDEFDALNYYGVGA